VRSSPHHVKIKVAGERHRTPYRTGFEPGVVVKLVAPKVFVRHRVHYVFKKWRGVNGQAKKRRKLTVTVGDDPIALKAVYRRARR
jgi:hypothetical protein